MAITIYKELADKNRPMTMSTILADELWYITGSSLLDPFPNVFVVVCKDIF